MGFWQIVIILFFVIVVSMVVGLKKPIKEKLIVLKGNWKYCREESIACEKVNSPISDMPYGDFIDQGIACVENDNPVIRFVDVAEDVKYG